MVDRLTPIGTSVDNAAVATVGNPFQARYFSRDHQEVAQESLIVRVRHLNSCQGPFWHDENVYRRLRIYVAEGHALVVFVYNVNRDFATDNLGENGFFSHLQITRGDGSKLKTTFT